jgi:hypothetical protein
MHSPALALAWQLWGRHRLALAVACLLLFAFAGLFHALPSGTLEPWHGALSSFQFAMVLVYVASVFAYGFDSRMEAPESGFPARLFTLPVRTRVLVGWPMVQGVATVALLWAAWAFFVLRPCRIEVPLALTTLLAGAFTAVLQALLWLPFGLPWVRLVTALLVLPVLLLAPLYGPLFGATEPGLRVCFAALIPLAYGVALAGVARARRGETSDWRGLFRPLRSAARRPAWRPPPFSSPARAQLWFERRRRFLSFPLVVGCFATFHLAIVHWIELTEDGKIRLGSNFLFFPLLVAPFVGCYLGRLGTSAGNPYQLSAFTATRPISSGALVAAKLQVAALSTLAAWAVVLLAASVWFLDAGGFAQLPKWWEHLRQQHPAWKLGAAVLLAAAVLLLLTWRLLVENLWIGLTGRPWVFRGCLLAYSTGFTLAVIRFARLADEPGFIDRLREALPWWAGTAVLLKLLASAWALRALVRRELLEARTLKRLLGGWLLAAAALFALAYAVVPSEAVSLPLLAFGVVLCLPLARIAAAPLALEWNRHR